MRGLDFGGGLIGLIILVLDILAIIEIVKSGMSITAKLLWILIILVAPVIGLILYYLLGRKKVL